MMSTSYFYLDYTPDLSSVRITFHVDDGKARKGGVVYQRKMVDMLTLEDTEPPAMLAVDVNIGYLPWIKL